MTYEDIQKIQNEAAMAEIEQIQLEERLNKRFAKAEDAHAYVREQKHADKLYVRREKDGTFTVRPIVILDVNNIPVRDGDILFCPKDRYCRASITKLEHEDGEDEIAFVGLRINEKGESTLDIVERFDNRCRKKYHGISHHRYEMKWYDKGLWFSEGIAEKECDTEKDALLMLFPAILSVFVYIVCSIDYMLATIGDGKALKKAEATEAALLFDDTDTFTSLCGLCGLEGTSSV